MRVYCLSTDTGKKLESHLVGVSKIVVLRTQKILIVIVNHSLRPNTMIKFFSYININLNNLFYNCLA